MTEESKTKDASPKKRGINARAVQEKKTTNRVSKRTASAKKTAETSKVTSVKKTTTKKTTKKPVVKKTTTKPEKSTVVRVTKPVEKKTTKPKAKNAKKPADISKKVAEESRNNDTDFNKNAAKKSQANDAYFETLQLNSEPEKRTSKIIPRDVTRNRQEIENPSTPVNAKPSLKDVTIKPAAAEKPAAKPFAKIKAPEPAPKLTAKELKEQEIKKAINTAKHLPENSSKKRTRKIGLISRFGWVRLTLMITCTATAVVALVYFINSASIEGSLKVAASHSGIEAAYPERVPSGYKLSDVSSSNSRVVMNYKSDDGAFSLSEEPTNWNSEALLNNYIKKNYTNDEYSVVVEQGLTIYMGTNWEAWVNGGTLYKLIVKDGSLTKKQLKMIATSL